MREKKGADATICIRATHLSPIKGRRAYSAPARHAPGGIMREKKGADATIHLGDAPLPDKRPTLCHSEGAERPWNLNCLLFG